MNRRFFLRTTIGASLACGALSVGVGSLFSGCSGVKRGDVKPGGQDSEPVLGLTREGLDILRYASLAPSGHNTQPWSVRTVGPWEWGIGIDPKRCLPAVDPDNREALLSLGAFVENLCLAAGAIGYEARVEMAPRTSFDGEIVRVLLRPDKPTPYPLERLTDRRTVRKGFLPRELKAEDVRFLSGLLRGRIFYFPRSSKHADCIKAGAIEAFRHQTGRDDAQKELARWLRFKNGEAMEKRDGLTSEGMEITGLPGWFFRNFMSEGDVTEVGFRRRSIDTAVKIAEEGAGWLIVTSSGESAADLIETGRRFERMALLARERMLALHPMTQQLEENEWKREIARLHGKDLIPQFVLRVGYLEKYPNPVSLRRPVEAFVRG